MLKIKSKTVRRPCNISTNFIMQRIPQNNFKNYSIIIAKAIRGRSRRAGLNG